MKILSIAALVFIAACTTVTDPIDVGNGTYMLGSRTMGGLDSWVEINAANHKRANDFCGNTGKVADILSKGTAGARGWTPMESDLTFQCVSR